MLWWRYYVAFSLAPPGLQRGNQFYWICFKESGILKLQWHISAFFYLHPVRPGIHQFVYFIRHWLLVLISTYRFKTSVYKGMICFLWLLYRDIHHQQLCALPLMFYHIFLIIIHRVANCIFIWRKSCQTALPYWFRYLQEIHSCLGLSLLIFPFFPGCLSFYYAYKALWVHHCLLLLSIGCFTCINILYLFVVRFLQGFGILQ